MLLGGGWSRGSPACRSGDQGWQYRSPHQWSDPAPARCIRRYQHYSRSTWARWQGRGMSQSCEPYLVNLVDEAAQSCTMWYWTRTVQQSPCHTAVSETVTAYLWTTGSTAIHACVLDAAAGAKLVALLLDLYCQLTSRRHNQHDRTITTLCS